MKKLLLLSLILCLVLCSCFGKPKETTTAETTAEPPETTQITVATTAETTVETTELPVTEVTLDLGGDVDVKYEVLVLEDEKIDEIISTQSAKILASYIPNISSIKEMGGRAEYDVKLASLYKSEEIISAVFKGSYAIYYENSEEGGDVLYTINIDPANGKILETPDIINYEKMLAAYKGGRFDMVPDFSQYNAAYGIYPYVSVEKIEEVLRLGIYVTKSGMYEEVLGYYITPKDADDFLKIQLTEEN